MSNIVKLEPAASHVQINPIVAVQPRDVYGNRLVYPANTQAEILAKMAGTKTLTIDTLLLAQAMGFRIVAVYPSGEIQVPDPRSLFQTAAGATESANRRRGYRFNRLGLN